MAVSPNRGTRDSSRAPAGRQTDTAAPRRNSHCQGAMAERGMPAMQTDIASWLEPLLCAAERQPAIDLWALMNSATYPVPQAPDLATVVDWVRFGQLLRQQLGWDAYPAAPDGPDGAVAPW